MKKKVFFLAAFTSLLLTKSFAQSWSATGNSGTNPSTNFLGTTDSKALVFKTNNAERMRILQGGKIGIGITNPQQKLDVNGNINIGKGFSLYMANQRVLHVDSLNSNIFLGNGTGIAATTSFGNTAAGFQTMASSNNSYYNTAYGAQVLRFNTSGNYNTAVGGLAMWNNTSGNDNTAIGLYSLFGNTTGSYNVATGEYALGSNTIGNNNAAFGFRALYNNTTGSENVATGYGALYNNTTGIFNTAVGKEALYASSTAGYNTATGYRAMFYNTAGTSNTANGWEALYGNTSGINNTATGIGALYSNTGGYYNTGVGDYALYSNYNAWGNTAIGSLAGSSYNNGYYNTFIGSFADATTSDIYNSTALGSSTYVSAPNQVRIGNSFVSSIGGYANWTNISDGRVKKNIKQNVPGLAFINKLNPVTYNLDLDAADKIVQRPIAKDKDGKLLKTEQPSQTEMNARMAKQQVVYTGFVAQEVEKAAKELKYDFSGVDAAKNDKDLYGIRYSEFVVPLVKAVQELSAMNEALQKQNDAQQKEIDELKTMVRGSGQNNSSAQTESALKTANVSLAQNIPNPFAGTTTINYVLPEKYAAAQILVTDKTGRQIKQVNISGKKGNGSISFEANTLSSGTYNYSLIIDGKIAGSKQMVVLK